MIKVTPLERFRMLDAFDFKANEPLLMSDTLAGEFLKSVQCEVEQMPFDDMQKEDDPKNILIVRAGGFGDIPNLTPAIRTLKEKSGVSVSVCCFERYGDIISEWPLVDEIIDYPPTVEKCDSYDQVIWLENTIENNPDSATVPMVDIYNEKCGVQPRSNELTYIMTDNEKIAMRERYKLTKPSEDMKRIGIQFQASQNYRTYPQMGELIQALHGLAHDLYILGSPGESEAENYERVTNLMQAQPSLNIRDSAAFIATCDLVIGPDSALIHIAGALGIPAIGIFGPIASKNRISYAPSVVGIDGKGKCARCNWHVAGVRAFPEGMPCEKEGMCVVLRGIKATRIANLAKKMLK